MGRIILYIMEQKKMFETSNQYMLAYKPVASSNLTQLLQPP